MEGYPLNKEEALKLADDLEELHEQDLIDGVAHLSMPQASAMIRRLVEELDKKPLSDEDIDAIGDEVSSLIDTYAGRREFARAIEERHGIK